MTELPFRRSSGALLVDGDRVLLAEHRTHAGPSVWVAPGGGVEGNESLHDALAREVFEETGLRITATHRPRLVWIQTVPFKEMHAQGFVGVINHDFLLDVTKFDPGAVLPLAHPGTRTARASSTSAGGRCQLSMQRTAMESWSRRETSR